MGLFHFETPRSRFSAGATSAMNENPHEPRRHRRRLGSIDLARGVAVVLMVGAHATDAFLGDSWKQNDLWYAINILFGFVAPAFIFLSGLALWHALTGRSGNDEHRGRIATRYLTILLLGYWLQLPVLSLRQLIFNQRPDELARLFDANILQLIAVAGLIALGLAMALRSPDRARIASLLLGITAILLTPSISAGTLYLGLPLAIRPYVAPSPPATFPLLPYLAYFMVGFSLSPHLTGAAQSLRKRTIVLLFGALLLGLGLALDPLLAPFPPYNDFWGPSIQHVFFRLGGIIVLFACSLHAMALWPYGSGLLAYLGRNSLAIYVLHLMLIYGSPMTMGMRYWFGGALDGRLHPVATLATTVAVLALCTAAISLWRWLRTEHPRIALWLKRLWWGLFWGLFLLQP